MPSGVRGGRSEDAQTAGGQHPHRHRSPSTMARMLCTTKRNGVVCSQAQMSSVASFPSAASMCLRCAGVSWRPVCRARTAWVVNSLHTCTAPVSSSSRALTARVCTSVTLDIAAQTCVHKGSARAWPCRQGGLQPDVRMWGGTRRHRALHSRHSRDGAAPIR